MAADVYDELCAVRALELVKGLGVHVGLQLNLLELLALLLHQSAIDPKHESRHRLYLGLLDGLLLGLLFVSLGLGLFLGQQKVVFFHLLRQKAPVLLGVRDGALPRGSASP